MASPRMVRVALPQHLRRLAAAGDHAGDDEVSIAVDGPVTVRSVLDALEQAYPVLRGTIRDHVTHKRRPFLRFYACERDFSLETQDVRLPDAIVDGSEPFLVVGAIAGG